MMPANARRGRAWRVLISALAGSGLTALAPLASGALAAESSGSAGEGSQTTSTSAETTSRESPNPAPTTTSTPAPTTPAPATTPATTPSTTTGATTPPATTTSGASEPPAPAKPSAKRPTVVVQRGQKTTEAKRENATSTGAKPATGAQAPGANGANNVAAPPEVVAAQVGALAAELAGSAASTQALDFYRIPLFLLPIYQAAAVQYGVPWQILAAINEIETDYGIDLSVSTAGAVGWMQFMPTTWIQYGVDALNSGYADPYNPVDAIFAAARYLRAAGAATDLHTAILAYNHSEEYVQSVLLRAKLISSYPKGVIATLTGLTDGELPIAGKHVTWGALSTESGARASSSSATAGATALTDAAKPASTSKSVASPTTSATSGAAPAPSAAASVANGAKQPQPLQLIDLMSSPSADVVAAQDGRIVKLGHSKKLGQYVVLRDVYGDLFTYSGMGSIASHYRKPKLPRAAASSTTSALPAVADAGEPKPKLPATAGNHPPVTLKVKAPAPGAQSGASAEAEPAPAQTGKVRLFAHPGNPDAIASAATRRASSRSTKAGDALPLRVGSVVSQGTVLGSVRTPPHAHDGHLGFAIRPGGDSATIDPRPILENWMQLSTALHPQGASGETDLLGATAGGVFLLSKGELERTVLSDPGIGVYACGRQDIASGAIDKRVLAVLEFLSRIGLKPTVSALRCGHSEMTVSGFVSEHYTGDAVDISAINGIPIAGHQGAGSITDLTIRALLTLQGEFVPHQIISLMQYPGAPNTLAMPEHWNHIHVGFRPVAGDVPLSPAAAAKAARSAGAGKTAPAPIVTPSPLSSTQWNQLVSRIGSLPAPKVTTKPSGSAIKDPKRPQPGQ
ncbi:MAG TPA: lytic murein transglycosylase [Solirubrobacteraceae bacterium]|nr:lytic murein transglycosylase [Solirubrobacteraceae bacterium]